MRADRGLRTGDGSVSGNKVNNGKITNKKARTEYSCHIIMKEKYSGSSWVGVQLSAGVGVGADFHVIESKTVQT